MTSIDSKWIRGKVDLAAIEQGCRFESARGRHVIEFLEKYCRQSQGKWNGKPLTLLEWQKDLVMRLFSWIRADGTRRYRTAYVEIPKKNGKSTLISGLSLYALIADGEATSEVYINAFNRQQASIVFEEAERMVRNSPALSKILEIIPSGKRIVHEGSHSKLIAMSSEVPSKDGINSHWVIFDELHRQRTSALWDIFEFAGSARSQPMNLSITTAGYDRESICWKQHEYTEKVNRGDVLDTAHLGVIYGATVDDDPFDPEIWKKANPSIGVTFSMDDFAREAKKTRETPSRMNNWLRLRLNVWTQANNAFLTRASWDDCRGIQTPAEIELDHQGENAWGGLDLSSTTDLTALVWIFGDGAVLARFWLPEARIDASSLRDAVPYRDWVRDGFLRLTPGAVIDYSYVRAQILADAEKFKVKRLFIDPFAATQVATQLSEQDGLPVLFLRQGFLSLSPPTKELERLILSKQIFHGGNPILDWNANNVAIETDAAGNIKPSKRASTARIDGFAALINAVAARSADGDHTQDDELSIYDSRGVLVI